MKWLDVLNPARVSLKAMTDYIQDETNVLGLFKVDVARDALHLPLLDGWIDNMQNFKAAKENLRRACDSVIFRWTKQFNELVKRLRKATSSPRSASKVLGQLAGKMDTMLQCSALASPQREGHGVCSRS